jgi:hypothetical protein
MKKAIATGARFSRFPCSTPRFHVPVTVVTLTSNLSKLFWAKFEGAEAAFSIRAFRLGENHKPINSRRLVILISLTVA